MLDGLDIVHHYTLYVSEYGKQVFETTAFEEEKRRWDRKS